jgi:hypothetical protein
VLVQERDSLADVDLDAIERVPLEVRIDLTAEHHLVAPAASRVSLRPLVVEVEVAFVAQEIGLRRESGEAQRG